MESIHIRMHVGNLILHFLVFIRRNTFVNMYDSSMRSIAVGAILLRCINIIEFVSSQIGTKWCATHYCQFILYVERTSYVYVCCEQSTCICICIGKIFSLNHLLSSCIDLLSSPSLHRSHIISTNVWRVKCFLQLRNIE